MNPKESLVLIRGLQSWNTPNKLKRISRIQNAGYKFQRILKKSLPNEFCIHHDMALMSLFSKKITYDMEESQKKLLLRPRSQEKTVRCWRILKNPLQEHLKNLGNAKESHGTFPRKNLLVSNVVWDRLGNPQIILKRFTKIWSATSTYTTLLPALKS